MINPRRIAGRIKCRIQKWLTVRSWERDAKKLRKEIKPQQTSTIPTDAKVLVLAPHSDDEWIGCSQIIKNCPNTVICSMEMEGGDDASKHQLRIEEMKSVAKLFNRKFVAVDAKDRLSTLVEIIKTEQPDYICCPSIFDWHPEHIEVIKIFKVAVEKTAYNANILSYHVSVPMPVGMCNIAYPMSKEKQQAKWHVFSDSYKTQSFMAILRFQKQEEIDGAICNAYAAEVYNCLYARDWKDFVSTRILNFEERNVLKTRIGFIYKIRNTIDVICQNKYI